jgi:hypothetical protein
VYVEVNREGVEDEVLRTLRESEETYSLTGLIKHLKGQGMPDSAVRAALWRLIDRTDVVLTDNWELHSAR